MKSEVALPIAIFQEGQAGSEANRKKFDELMARVGTVQDGICPKHGRVKMTITHNNIGVVGNEHLFHCVCEHKHEWVIARLTGRDLS